MKYILSIDQGTTGSRAFIFDKSGFIVSSAYSEFRQIYPQAGWVEHDPLEIWATVDKVIRSALLKKNIKVRDIASIGITNQRETTIIWDRLSGKPVYNAIVWQCRRTAEICESLKKKGYADVVRSKTGLVVDAYFSGTKIKWLLDNIKGLRLRAARGEICFGTLDSWLIWKLTGGASHVTDFTNASRTLIFNIKEKQWDNALLKLLDIPRNILPRVQGSSSLFGRTSGRSCGLPLGIPISGCAGDQQAALFGQGCFFPGEIKNTYGTGCFLLMNTGSDFLISKNGLLSTLACGSKGEPVYALEGAVFIAGAAVQWLRDGLKLIKTSAESQILAKRVSDNGGVYFVPAFVGLGAPYWDSAARGLMSGITRGTNAGHIARATLESIAYQVKDVADLMQVETGKKIIRLKVDGGASSNDLLMQFQSDILGAEIIRPNIVESTAKGVAMLAGLAVGFWKGHREFKSALTAGKTFLPKIDKRTRVALYSGWLKAVRKARA